MSLVRFVIIKCDVDVKERKKKKVCHGNDNQSRKKQNQTEERIGLDSLHFH